MAQSQQPSPIEPLALSLHSSVMEERIKIRKLRGSDDSLIDKAKAVCTSRAKHRTNSLLPTGRQVFSHLQ